MKGNVVYGIVGKVLRGVSLHWLIGMLQRVLQTSKMGETSTRGLYKCSILEDFSGASFLVSVEMGRLSST
jgi:hypothetical protein